MNLVEFCGVIWLEDQLGYSLPRRMYNKFPLAYVRKIFPDVLHSSKCRRHYENFCRRVSVPYAVNVSPRTARICEYVVKLVNDQFLVRSVGVFHGVDFLSTADY